MPSAGSFLAGPGTGSVRRVIDAHHHLWDLTAREHRWLMGGQAWATDDELARLRRSFTLADLARLAAEAGVTSTVVIQTAAEPARPLRARLSPGWPPARLRFPAAIPRGRARA